MILSNPSLSKLFMEVLKFNNKSKIRLCSSLTHLEKKGLIVMNSTFDELGRLLISPQAVYCGFDPTAPSLHVGNLLALIGLIHFQRLGHQPIALIGGATGLIGDPTHRTVERERLDKVTSVANASRIKETIERVFENHERYLWKVDSKLKPVIICDNNDWYSNINVIDFLHNSGQRFRMNDLLRRSSVQARMESTDGMSLTEFVYQVFQSHDWLHLYQNFQCRIQLGGNDQTGNIMSGLHLIKTFHEEELFGVTVPILTSDITGKKIGKSSGGHSLWLKEDMTSAYEMYQFFYNLWDSEVERYLRLMTYLSDAEIDEIMKSDPTSRTAQKKVAEQVVLLLHGREGLESALRCTMVLFGSSLEHLKQLNKTEIESSFPGAGTVTLPLNGNCSLKDLVLATHHCQKIIMSRKPNTQQVSVDFVANHRARDLIEAGAVKINFEKNCNPEKKLTEEFVISSCNWTLLTIAKKHNYIIYWQTSL